MDWALAIELNRTALVRVVTALFTAAGLVPGGDDAKALAAVALPRHLRSTLVRMLQPENGKALPRKLV